MAERIYTNGEINVRWQSDLCVHCEACWRGLPAVFDPQARPWVRMNAATTQEIRTQVYQCPSGALSIVEGGAGMAHVRGEGVSGDSGKGD